MIEDVGYFPKFQAKLMKDDTYDKEDVFQDVADILSIIALTKSLTQKKDEQVVLSYYEESRMPISKSDAEESVFVIMLNIQKRLDGRMLKGIWLFKEVLTFE